MTKKVTNAMCADALKKNMGLVTPAANALGITRQALWSRINKNKSVQKAFNEAKETVLDLAEHKLIGKMNAGDLGALCFYLKCQGKSRGYVERQEVEITDRTISIILPSDMKDEE